MAKGRKTGGKDFVKGDTRAGRPPQPLDVKEIRKLTTEEFVRALNRYWRMTKAEIQAQARNTALPAGDLAIIAVLHGAIGSGDQRRLEFLLNYMIGKLIQPLKVDAHVTAHGAILALIEEIEKEGEDGGK